MKTELWSVLHGSLAAVFKEKLDYRDYLGVSLSIIPFKLANTSKVTRGESEFKR